MTDNEKLIEEAAATIAVAELVSTHRTWGDLIEPQKDEYRRVARAVLAVFEKALTPTDDEREALSEFLFTVYEHGTQPNALREADAILSFLRSRRSEVPEPRAEEPDLPNGHAPIEKLAPFLARRIVGAPEGPTVTQEAIALLDAMNAEGRIIYADYSRLQDLISSSEPQAEPSDAQVLAALNAYNDDSDAALRDWSPYKVNAMRAALRAAGDVR